MAVVVSEIVTAVIEVVIERVVVIFVELIDVIP